MHCGMSLRIGRDAVQDVSHARHEVHAQPGTLPVIPVGGGGELARASGKSRTGRLIVGAGP